MQKAASPSGKPLSEQQVAFYEQRGYLVVENAVPPDVIAQAIHATERLVEESRHIRSSDAHYDLERGHNPQEPRIRRIKEPIALDPIFRELCLSERILDMSAQLIGPEIRYISSILNLKGARFGSPVEWHQDLAFTPQSNDDLVAPTVAMDDCTEQNGCLMMIPGSHRGPIYNHHRDGVYYGALDTDKEGLDITKAVMVPAPAGSVTFVHCRTIHGSAPNYSNSPRRVCFVELAAVDAWPLLGVQHLAHFNERILRGKPVSEYRSIEQSVRIPLPQRGWHGPPDPSLNPSPRATNAE